jgi:methylated-DNA-[protein]-cysteine S-methyltransferase
VRTTDPATFASVPSPLGALVVVASDAGVAGVYFPPSGHRRSPVAGPGWAQEDGRGRASAVLAQARAQLGEYFSGARTTFDVPLDSGGSPFQRRVWDALRTIPYGTTVSYSDLARRLGDVRATRAVGAANAKNPVPIIVPCHRVVGARGELTGFGGGLDRKRWLLEHEGALMMLGG